MNIGFMSTMRCINNGLNKGVDVVANAVEKKYNHMTGADITGNGVVRRMKSLKKARRFQANISAICSLAGSTASAISPKCTLFPGSELLLAGVWEGCNAIESGNAIKTLKPQYKEIVKRAKSIYG